MIIFVSGLNFQGKQYLIINIRVILNFISNIVIIVIGIFFESLVYAGLSFFMFNILRSLFNYYYFLINNKYLTFSFKRISTKVTLKLIRKSMGHTLEILSNIIKHPGQIVLLGVFFNPQIIAYVSTCKTLFYFLPMRLINVLIRISYYEYALTFAKKKFSTLKHNHIRHIIITFGLIIILFIGSITIGPLVYKLWLNNKFDLSFIFLLIIIFEASIYSLKSTLTILLSSLNKNLTINIVELIAIIIAMLTSYYFLFLGYSFIVNFIIILISSFTTFIISIFFVNRFYNKLSTYKNV